MTREILIATRLTQMALGLLLDTRGIEPALRRKLIFYFLHMTCGVAQPAIAAVNGCTKQNVSKQIKAIEALRDEDFVFDGRLNELEQLILDGGVNE